MVGKEIVGREFVGRGIVGRVIRVGNLGRGNVEGRSWIGSYPAKKDKTTYA